MTMLYFVLAFIISYTIGSIPFGLIIGKVLFKTDVTTVGSGNIGATNITRNFGKKIGLIVFLLDAFKGFLSAWICVSLLPVGFVYLAALGGVLGHCHSMFMKFKGGKAISSNFGMILFFSPTLTLLGLLSFGLILKISRYVSLSSVISAITMLIISIFNSELWLTTLLLCSTALITFKHLPNFKRIKLGIEPKTKAKGNDI